MIVRSLPWLLYVLQATDGRSIELYRCDFFDMTRYGVLPVTSLADIP